MDYGFMEITHWDIFLLVTISSMTILIAYLKHPRSKALILSLPLPFSLMFLSLGRPMDSTNTAALLVLLMYTHAVRFLRYSFKLPIIVCILLSAALYVLVGGFLAAVVPKTDAAFWIISAVMIIIALIVRKLEPKLLEPAYRSPLPLHIKIPIILVLVAVLLTLKQLLKGFMTLFPMVGVFASYEARFSLWTNCRQIPIVMLTMIPMFAAIKITQNYLGTFASLACGWVVYLTAMIPVFRSLYADTRPAAGEAAAEEPR
jgi:hypothetical protein